MSVTDLWAGKSRAEVAELRAAGRPRYLRRWWGPETSPTTGKAIHHSQRYREAQRVQAELDDATQKAQPRAQALRRSSVTVATLLDRHLAARTDRAPKTVEVDRYHAGVVQERFGDRSVITLDTTEIETWTQRAGVARSSRKKQLEMLRAAIRRGIRDGLVDTDPTEGLVVSLGHREMDHWSAGQLMAVVSAASSDMDHALLITLGLMGIRVGEARSLRVGSVSRGDLRVINGGGGSGTTKTSSSLRTLPVPATVLPWLRRQAGSRPRSEWMFPSPRIPGAAIGESYPDDALVRALTAANRNRSEPIPRINVHGLRHTFAAIALSEAHADIIAVSRYLGHARPSITLDRYGHLASRGLVPLVADIDAVVSDESTSATGPATTS